MFEMYQCIGKYIKVGKVYNYLLRIILNLCRFHQILMVEESELRLEAVRKY